MPLSPNYNPKVNETQIYSQWMDVKIGNPENQSLKKLPLVKGVQSYSFVGVAKTHSILMPPPNLTGNLHAGHAFQHYLMDTLSRIARQNGERNLWFPGVDHAGLQLEGVIDGLIKKGEFDNCIKETCLSKGIKTQNLDGVKKEDLPKYLKTNCPDLWLECAWSKVNLWRDNQKNQSSVLGDTPDYDRSLFTLDPQNLEMVNYAFTKYWQDGLIYKGSYLVNWSVGLQTALSDVAGEIEYEKRIDPFVTFQYAAKRIEFKTPELESKYSDIIPYLKSFENWKRLSLSTVRPETKFTDLAVVMHPTKYDEYYNENIFENITDQNLASQFIEDIKNKNIFVYYHLPTLVSQDIKLLFSDKVDPDFGTGLVKLTPGHDLFDYELYNEFVAEGDLPAGLVQLCIGRDGKLNSEYCGEFAGLTVEQSRPPILKRLVETEFVPKKINYEDEIPARDNLLSDNEFKELKLENQIEYLKINYCDYQIDWNYEHNVTICERTKTVVEPLISEEFFISYHKEFNWKPIAKDLSKTIINQGKKTNLQKLGIEAVNATNFYSPEYKERGINFLNNIKDWCISRNLIWGHKMPVWYNLDTNPERIFYSYEQLKSNPELNNQFHISQYKPKTPGNWVQEEKILDTWFSSCLWPLSTLRYPDFVVQAKVKSNIIFIGGGDVFEDEIEYQNYLKDSQVRLDSTTTRGWRSKLQEDLKPYGIEIIAPRMPSKDNAKYADWKIVFDKIVPFINSNSILIGHSLGGSFLLKYLSENQLQIDSVQILAAPITGCFDFDTRDFDALKDYNIALHHSTDDFVVDYAQFIQLQNSLPSAKVNSYESYNHFLISDFPELTKVLLEKLQSNNVQNDFETYYPTQQMTTGKDIFYQWIVRMTTLSYYFTAQIPYQDLVITPTILDDKGKKMSKSLGNGMDPVAQIDKYSSDSMRMAMLGGMIPDRNIKMGGRLADELCEKYRNFGNKMWNVARFFEYQESKIEE